MIMNLGRMEGGRTGPEPGLHIRHARSADQVDKMRSIEGRGICFMCNEHVQEFYDESGDLLHAGEFVNLVRNQFPYEQAALHYLLIPKRHVTTLAELDIPEFQEMLEIAQAVEQNENLQGGGLAMRFGNPELTGATVSHLHMHLLVADENIGPNDKPLKFRLSRRID